MFRQIRDRVVTIEAQRTAAVEELAQLRPNEGPQDSDLLDFLPIGEIEPPSEPTDA